MGNYLGNLVYQRMKEIEAVTMNDDEMLRWMHIS